MRIPLIRDPRNPRPVDVIHRNPRPEWIPNPRGSASSAIAPVTLSSAPPATRIQGRIPCVIAMPVAQRFAAIIAVSASLLLSRPAHAQYVMEHLGRGVVAVRASESTVYVGWRLLGTDPAEIAFNVYRSTNGGAASKLNAAPITATTDFVDATADLSLTNVYTVRPVRAGRELAASAPATLRGNAPIQQFLTVPLQRPPGGAVDVPPGARTANYTYSPNDTSVGGPRWRRRIRDRREVGSLECARYRVAGAVGPSAARRLPSGRHPSVADRPWQEHPRRCPLHAVHRLRPRRRRPCRSGLQDGGRDRGRPGPRHRRRVEGLSLAGGADRRRAGEGRRRPPLREGARRS